MILRTQRLELFPWAPGDVELLARWAAEPAVMRFINDGTLWSREKAQDRSERQLAHWREHGFGWRIARTLDTGDPVGLLALNRAPEDTPGLSPADHEIGWWLDPAHWGSGYAREGAAVVRDDAFGRLRAPSVVARVQPGNAASLAVATAIGLRHEASTRTTAGIPVEVLRGLAPV